MQNSPKSCWGCGQPLVFRIIKGKNGNHCIPFLAKNANVQHSCPKPAKRLPVFLPAMLDCSEKIKCECGAPVYRVPARNEMAQFDFALQFDATSWPWKVHQCGFLPGIWDCNIQSLTNDCHDENLPGPYRLVIIVCVKKIAGSDPLYLFALKGVDEERECSYYRSPKALSTSVLPLLCGSLAVSCGEGDKQKLLINKKNKNILLAWDSKGSSESMLQSSWWEKQTPA
jgi:hypothetical protein